MIDALQDVERLEAGDHDRHAVARGERLVLLEAHDGADMAGGEEALDAVVGRIEDRLASPAAPARARPASRSSRGPRAWRGRRPWRWPARWSRSRRRRTRPRGRDWRARSRAHRAANRRCARRRRAPWPRAGRRRCPARAACRRTSRRSRPGRRGDLDRLVDILDRRHADRAARPVHQRDAGGSSSSMP